MRKGDDGEKKWGGKIMVKIVATNAVASRPPERRPTATPTARAKIQPGEIRFFVNMPCVETKAPFGHQFMIKGLRGGS